MQPEDPEALNALSYQIVAAAIEVHRHIGPGLLESVYRTCLVYELRQAGIEVMTEQLVPVIYKSVVLGESYRIDALVNGTIVLELKSSETILPVHLAQLLSYLRLANKPLGLV